MTDRQMTNLQTDSSSQTDRQPVFVIDRSEFEPSCHQRRSRWSLKPCISYYPSSYISCVQLPFQLLSSSVLILSCIIARNRRSNYHLRLGQPFATACTRALLATPRTCIQKLFCKTSFFQGAAEGPPGSDFCICALVTRPVLLDWTDQQRRFLQESDQQIRSLIVKETTVMLYFTSRCCSFLIFWTATDKSSISCNQIFENTVQISYCNVVTLSET